MKSINNQKSVMRFAAFLVAFGLFAVGVVAPEASADPPNEFNVTVSFPDINPCSDTPMLVTLHLEIREDVHQNGNVIVHIKRTGSTSDGYVMEHGVENFVFNGNVQRSAFTDTMRHDDGSQFKAQGVFVSTEDGPLVDRFRLRCVGG